MRLTVTSAAASHFQEEWGFRSGDFVRLFVRYGGHSTVQPSYSIGIAKDTPQDPGVSALEQGITFYVERDELWYLDDKDLTVDYKEGQREIVFES